MYIPVQLHDFIPTFYMHRKIIGFSHIAHGQDIPADEKAQDKGILRNNKADFKRTKKQTWSF